MSRRFRRIAIICVLLLLPLAAYRLWDYIELRRLIAEIEAIQAKGEPLSDPRAARVYDRLPADQQRAGDYYVAAAALVQRIKPQAATGPFHLWLATANTRRDQAPREGLRTVVDASPEALALADKAAALPFGGLPPGVDYGNRFSGLLTLSRLVGARTLLLALDGRGDEAVDSAIVALAVRRALWDLRWMIPQDDHEIAAILSLSTPSAAALRRLDAALETPMPAVDPIDQVLAARAEYLGLLWRRYYGGDPAVPTSYTLPMRSVGETLLRPYISLRAVRSLQTWAMMIPASRLPAVRRLEAMQRIAEARAAMAPELVSAFMRTRVQTDVLTIDRCARLAIAVERFRRDHAGTLPESLAQLVPAYLPDLPLDPANDAPLHYRAQADAYTVYGVGRDQQDDGGDLTSELRPGLRPETAARAIGGRDLGLRVLLH